MTAPRLTSVIMVTRHTGKILERAIASVLAQTADVELVLVNNGNPPEVEAQLIQRFKDEPLVRLMTGHGDVGLIKGRNLGARVARGDRLLFLEPDCIMRPDAVARLVGAEMGIKRPFMVGARIVTDQKRDKSGTRRNLLTPLTALVDGLGLHALFPKVRNFAREAMPKTLAEVPAITDDFMYLPRAEFMNLHGFDEVYADGPVGMDLCVRFSRGGGKIYFAPDVIVVQPVRPSARQAAKQCKAQARGYVRYFHENFSHIYPQPALWLVYLGVLIWSLAVEAKGLLPGRR